MSRKLSPKEAIKAILAMQGWRFTEGETAVAIKVFDTAVGKKEAHCYLQGRTLSAQYISEGRNILATCSQLLSPGWQSVRNLSDIQATSKFCRDVDAAVAASYAARLL